MGTLIEITLIGEDEEPAKKAVLQAFQEIKRIEQLMSPWIDSSDVVRINSSAGKEWVKVSPETIVVIKKAQEISELSGGWIRYYCWPSHSTLANSERKRDPSIG